MDYAAGAEERMVSERVQQKLHQVNVAAKEHLSPIQDHVNFTLQVLLPSLSLSLSLCVCMHVCVLLFLGTSFGMLSCFYDVGVVCL